ncbi:MAG: toxin-antitoxin system TumE family protein [Burkholderiales bacterium]
MARRQSGLDTLLDLHGEVLVQERGYWIKIEAWTIEPTEGVPHGIRYSLTLHDSKGTRVLGYDNAHAVKPSTKGFAGQRHEYDHVHRHAKDKGVPYGFSSAGQLVTDFFAEVDKVLKEIK